MDDTARFAWPVSSVAEAVERLAVASGFPAAGSREGRRPAKALDTLDSGVERFSRTLALDVEAGDVTYADVETVLRTSGPALLKLRDEHQDRILAVISASGGTVRLLAPDGSRRRMPIRTVTSWIRTHVERPLDDQVELLLTKAGIPDTRRPAARQALLNTRLGSLTATRCWVLRPSADASLWQHMRHARLPRRLMVFLIAYAAGVCANVGAWWLIGAAALCGRFVPGTLLAWSFLLLSLVPIALFARWAQGIFIVGISGILKQRLLGGALKLDPDETRHHGVGQHLARVLESEAVEALTLAGGFHAIAGVFEITVASIVFVAIEAYVSLGLLSLVLGALALTAAAHYWRRERWTLARLTLTHDLVERMVGHRTRLVQERQAHRHDDEDQALAEYVGHAKRMDHAAVGFAVLPRVWLILGLAGLARELVAAGSASGALAAGLGATLLAFGALGRIITSASALSDAAIGWKQVAPLLQALRRPEPRGYVDIATESLTQSRTRRSSPLIAAQDLTYKFGDRTDAVLRHCSFRIKAGDKIHLTGPSGGGKSTLVSLLTGLRAPASGLLLLDGLDRATLGLRGWRRRIAAAPQFHENHLFNDTLAFNLLMGRRWPPTAEDLQWAETVSRRLGLGELLARMPGGLFQVVGETGWQLSHGERSRVYMGRALLQGADLVVLDESFAELDPDSLQQCLPEAANLARSLLVVAHA